MISQEKLKILEAWNNRLFDELSIAEIMGLSKKKTKPWVFNALKLLAKHNLLITKKKSNINLYGLNLRNPFLFDLIQCLKAQRSLSFRQLGLIGDIINGMPIKNYCLLVFGSYAEEKQKEISDIDLCFLISAPDEEKIFKPYIDEIKLSHKIEMDDHYATFNDFVTMLLRSEENLAKQIFRKHIIFFNHNIYYQLLLEAYKNGFRQ